MEEAVEQEAAVKHYAYISGPMSNIPYNNFPLFDRCRDFLFAVKNWDSFSPADRDREEGWKPKQDGDVSEFDRNSAMWHDFNTILAKCNVIVMLPGWLDSGGAKAERVVAQEIGLPVYIYSPADNWVGGDGFNGDVLTFAAPWDPWAEPVIHASSLIVQGKTEPPPFIYDKLTYGFEEIRTVSASGGEKGVKLERPELIPPTAEEVEGLVYGYGATKYEPRNWERGYEWSKSYGALRRHLRLWWKGEDTDIESGLPHLGHARWHTGVLLDFSETHPEYDDRPRRK